MNYLLTPYAIAQFLTAIVSIFVTVITWKRRTVRSGWQLFLLFVAISIWSLANGFEAAAVPQDLKVFWSKIAYIGTQTSPVFLMLFTLAYTRRIQQMKSGIIALFFVFPVFVIIAAATNELHRLVWTDFSPGPLGTNSLIYHHGPVFWLNIAYIFTIVSFATTFLIVFAVRSQKIYRFQHYLIILASISPWMGLVLYILEFEPFLGLDTSTIGFLFTGIFLLIGISWGKMLNNVPIEHEILFSNVGDGIIVLDENQKIVDMNPAAQKHLSVKFANIVGQELEKITSIPEEINKKFNKDQISRFKMISPIDFRTWFNVSITPLQDNRKGFLGWVVFLEDITQRKGTEDKLKQVNQRLVQQLNEIRQLEDKFREAANRDSLTGVFNRGYLEETLLREIARAKRNNSPLSVIMIDVDNFKNINDTFGHKAGDKVVVALGKLLGSSTRGADCVSRYGGDEFVLVMPEMNKEHAYQRAEKWRNEIKKLQLMKSKQTIQFTISIGIATFPADGKTNEMLLDNADQALYCAKQAGRDCTRLANS